MANGALALIKKHIDKKAHLIGGFGRRIGTESETTTDIDIQLTVKYTEAVEKKLIKILKPKKWEHTIWLPMGIYFAATERFGNVDIFF